ncbi:MAG: hypothetical protein ACLP0J_10655 [Solirubrobacteraceae bacterium]
MSERKQGHLIGYTRISTDEQNLALQLDSLKQAGCRRVLKTSAPGRSSTDLALDEQGDQPGPVLGAVSRGAK